MKSSLIRPLIMGVFAFPLLVAGQQESVLAAGPQGRILVAGQQECVLAAGPQGRMPGAETAGGQVCHDIFFSNVPVNEVSPRAYRRFHRRFEAAGTGEYWFKSTEGYKISFTLDGHHEFAYFDLNGGFKCSIGYYQGRDAPGEAGDLVKRRFPDYRIAVVTEFNDGQKTYYTVQIRNPLFIKLLSVSDGRIEVISELSNGGAEGGSAEASR